MTKVMAARDVDSRSRRGKTEEVPLGGRAALTLAPVPFYGSP
jgi:hypothetical protein